MATDAPIQEIPQDQGFVAFINALPDKTATTIRFFERTDYFTVHGSDAIFVSKEVFKTLTVIKYIGTGSQKIESVCLSKLNFESLVRELLLIRQYRVEIYKNKGTGKAQDWRLECKASPGNLTQLEDVLFGSDGNELVDCKGVMAIKISIVNKEQVVGVAFAEAILREFTVCEFTDSHYLSELEAILVQLSPKECLLGIADPFVLNEVQKIVTRNNILLSDCKLGDFTTKDIHQDLDRLLKFEESKIQSSMLAEADLKVALSGLAAIIKYLELLADDSNFGQYMLATINSKQYMQIDMSACKALGLFPLSVEDNMNHSLLGILNKCRTSQGQRLLTQWIKQPLMDIIKIEERLNIVESFVDDTELRQSLYESYLRKFPDLQMLSKKFQRKKANLQDVYKIFVMLSQLPDFLMCLLKHSGKYVDVMKTTFCSDIQDRIDDFKSYQDMVKTVIDFDSVEHGEFMVKSDFDPKLKELRELMKKSQELIGAEIDKVARDLGLEPNKTVKLENCKQIGYYFRVTRKEEKALRNQKNYFTIDTKQSGVRFYNASLKTLNEKYLSLRTSYEKHQRTIVDQIVDVAASYCNPMKLLGGTVSHLDVLVAFSIAAFNAPKPYVRPTLTEKGKKGIILKQARHPCLEVQPNTDFIPNDIEMLKDKYVYHLITGPNMGGKSTFIRSVALNVLMAQIGSFVPCDEADISIVDAILTRVGAGDRPMTGVSTFMAEMLEVKHIIQTASADSLIIVDELGRGTSTYDGLGIAWALTEHIANSLKSYCLFTSHFYELAALSEQIPSVNNLHVTAHTSDQNITFLYRVKPGVCDQSFGVHVAEMAHFPKCITKFAKHKVDQLEEFEKLKIHGESDEILRGNYGAIGEIPKNKPKPVDEDLQQEEKVNTGIVKRKVEKLEVEKSEMNGSGHEPPSKKVRIVYEEAQKTIEAFVVNASNIDLTSENSGATVMDINEIKSQFQSSANPYIQELTKCCPPPTDDSI